MNLLELFKPSAPPAPFSITNGIVFGLRVYSPTGALASKLEEQHVALAGEILHDRDVTDVVIKHQLRPLPFQKKDISIGIAFEADPMICQDVFETLTKQLNHSYVHSVAIKSVRATFLAEVPELGRGATPITGFAKGK